MSSSRSPSGTSRDSEIMHEILAEGLYKFCIPAMVVGLGATFLLRKRFRLGKSSPAERGILISLHYYAGLSLGLNAGLAMYRPSLEKKILERIPNSRMAQEIRESRGK